MYAKVISISFIVGFIAACLLSGWYFKTTSDRSIRAIEDRYTAIESSNTKLREENNRVIILNNNLIKLQQEDATTLERAKFILGEYEKGTSATKDTIARIEKGIETLARLIKLLSEDE